MINIDDFPVPDSSIRGEPSDRPFASRIERASLPRISPYGRSEDVVEDYESSDSDEEALRMADERKRRHGNRGGNRGNKLSREKGARWARRGKLGGWTEMRMEKEIGDRVRHRVEAMQKTTFVPFCRPCLTRTRRCFRSSQRFETAFSRAKLQQYST